MERNEIEIAKLIFRIYPEDSIPEKSFRASIYSVRAAELLNGRLNSDLLSFVPNRNYRLQININDIKKGSLIFSLSVVAGIVGTVYKFIKDYPALRKGIIDIINDLRRFKGDSTGDSLKIDASQAYTLEPPEVTKLLTNRRYPFVLRDEEEFEVEVFTGTPYLSSRKTDAYALYLVETLKSWGLKTTWGNGHGTKVYFPKWDGKERIYVMYKKKAADTATVVKEILECESLLEVVLISDKEVQTKLCGEEDKYKMTNNLEIGYFVED